MGTMTTMGVRCILAPTRRRNKETPICEILASTASNRNFMIEADLIYVESRVDSTWLLITSQYNKNGSGYSFQMCDIKRTDIRVTSYNLLKKQKQGATTPPVTATWYLVLFSLPSELQV